MDVRFFLKSDEKEEDIKYYLQIKNWTESSLDLYLNFTNPEMMS